MKRGKQTGATAAASAPTAQPSFVRRVEGGIELSLRVVPGASRSAIVGVLGGRLKVRVVAPPEQGKANRAVIDLLREWLCVKDVEIVAGHTRPEKTVRVGGVTGVTEEQQQRLVRSVRKNK